MKDFYATLGIAPDAEADAIKAAYRQLAQVHHPDLRPGDPDANERFLAIKEAYECLSDEATRAAYDEAFVAYFPGYVLDVDEDDSEIPENATHAPVDDHDDGSMTLFRMFLVLLLPLLSGGLVMNFTGDFAWTVIAAVGGLAVAVWVASMSKEG